MFVQAVLKLIHCLHPVFRSSTGKKQYCTDKKINYERNNSTKARKCKPIQYVTDYRQGVKKGVKRAGWRFYRSVGGILDLPGFSLLTPGISKVIIVLIIV